ncbi:ATP-binding protein [Burkholderia sp. Bp9142]|uniref:ATP-binding protein n=1 Tax=Burkholderia sp. Bp9142 TaxID=2184573 RepID=UPI000F5A5842|nr:ATP-binding protein [Burkholderia sp. Bp9142]RQR27017.1 HAMP domain-containing protein [Burkholderia sp. Bp9142]
MKLGIASKLFLAILVPCAVAAVAMGVAQRISFENNFRDYVTSRNATRSDQLAQRLERTYAAHRNWTFVTDGPRAWAGFIDAIDGGPFDVPPGPPGPPKMMDAPAAGPGEFSPPPERRALPDPVAPDFRRGPPAILYDADRRRIAGMGPPPPPGAPLRPLKVDGKTVGWLFADDRGGPFHAADLQFRAEQLRMTWIIVGAAALLAALLAVVLTRAFLAPVRRMVDAGHLLASGDYTVRIPELGGDEFGQLAGDFNQLAASLESSARARRDFIADISHELRTPLAILRGELEALEDGVRPPSAATFASLQAEISMLNQLISDLHELSLADIGALTFERLPVDLAHLAEGATEAFRERLASKRLDLELEIPAEPVQISGDPYRLTQLMQNLLENALRYTDPGGKVRIAVEPGDGWLNVDVQDSFPAVPEPLLPHLFDRLFRVDASRSRQSGGSGLGLALCKHIVDAHGGTIAAMRSPYGGLWIRMRFPLAGLHHEH